MVVQQFRVRIQVESNTTKSAPSYAVSTSTTEDAQANSELANLPFDLAKYPQNYTTVNQNVPIFENGFKQTVAAAQKAKNNTRSNLL